MYFYFVFLSGVCVVVDKGVWMIYLGLNFCILEGIVYGKLEILDVVFYEYCVIVGDILCYIVSFIFEFN